MADLALYKFPIYQEIKSLAALSEPLHEFLKEFERENAAEFENFPTLAFAAIGDGMVKRWLEITESERIAVFSRIEELMLDPRTTIQVGVATGLVEALNHRIAAGEIDGSILNAYLGVETRKYWIAYDNFWGSSTPGITDT